MKIAKRQFNILVIEDNPGDFVLVEDFLFEQIEAPSLVQAKNFRQAKDIFLNHDNQFDVVLLDLSLADKTGEPLIKEIVELSGNIPVIVLTGYSDVDFGIRSLSLGVSDYILKEELTSISLFKSILYSSERKKAVSALEESEKKYSELFHLSPQPMWVFDLETLSFLNVNDAAINHYGYNREEFLLMNLRDIRPAEEIVKMNDALEKCKGKTHEICQGSFTHRKRSGELIQVDEQSNIIEYKGRKAAVVLVNDVTERLKYIKAIEAQNEKLREISWIQSHVVRAPLARLMGLVNLLKTLKAGGKDTSEILGYMTLCANELDGTIKDITAKTKTARADETPKKAGRPVI